MGLISMILSKNNGGGEPLAKTERIKIVTYDGNSEGKETVPGKYVGWGGNEIFVKVADRALTKSEIDEISLVMRGEKTSYSELIFEDFLGALLVNIGKFTFVVCITAEAVEKIGVPQGTYVLGNPEAYVSEIVSVTIHTIDPKYIPGAVLPVVEISTVISEENNFVAMLSEEESAALEALSFSPCIIKFSVDSPNSFGGTLEFSAYADCARPSGADSWGWMAECAQGTFQTMAEDGVWAAVFVVKTAG